MPILIVEGSNKVGKSTLIEAIRKECEYREIPYNIVKRRVAKNDKLYVTPEQMCEVAIEDIKEAVLNTDKKLVIYDRFHISEFVYGNLYRGYYNKYMLLINDMLSSIGAKVVFVKSNYNHIDNVDERLKLERLQEYFAQGIDKFKEGCNVEEILIESNESSYMKRKAVEILKCL